jgi:endonuclease/exonuclease/phosphatase (EEP) superfamily protein YafD
MATSPRARLPRAIATVLGAALIAAPWLWFFVRDRDGQVLDTIAVGLPLVGFVALVMLGLAALLARRWLPLLLGLSIAAACVVATVAPRLPRSEVQPTPAIRVAMANVYDANPVPDDAIAALEAREVDVLATVEMGSIFWDQLDGIDGLPYTVVYGELGVHARWPITLLPPLGLPRSRILRIRVDASGAPFILYVAHALNPLHDSSTFEDQRAFAESIVATAAQEQRPVVVMGDFNTSDRVVSYRVFIHSMRDAMRDGSVPGSTYYGGWWPWLQLRIDHVFVSPGWCGAGGSTFSVPGSDHRGIEVAVGPCA